MLDVPGPQAPGLDRAPNLAARDLYRALFPALAALHPARNPDTGYIEHVTLHADAHAAREDIEGLARVMAAMPDASSRLASTFGKWPGLFARLCLTFHLIEAAAARVRGPRRATSAAPCRHRRDRRPRPALHARQSWRPACCAPRP